MHSHLSSSSSPSFMSASDDSTASEEWQMLDDPTDFDSGLPYADEIAGHDLDTTPLLTRDAFEKISDTMHYVTQYGLLGRIISVQSKGIMETTNDSRLYLNTNAPFSAIVCGVQAAGSGKSHTVSTILENMLITGCSAVGTLSKPLCGLVLHYGESGASALPSEAAWISQSASSRIQSPPVVVYVSPSSLNTMKAVYSKLGSNIAVKPLYFQQSELDAAAFLSMMAISSTESAPLYMQIILSILRRLGENFSYDMFVLELEKCKKDFNPAQIAGVQQRMTLLTSFLDTTSPKRHYLAPSRFAKGQLTIIDLSDPFLDSSSACGLFEIVVRLFLRADVGTGKVLVVDEAHKYLSMYKGASGLTNALLAVIRQQRHLAMRVIISTQEPTVVPPVLLDLCTVAILHRFSSPSWWNHLVNHVSADFTESDAFDKVVKLQTGQAIILAASALGIFVPVKNMNDNKQKVTTALTHFGRRYLIVKTRRRITADGGKSILVLAEN